MKKILDYILAFIITSSILMLLLVSVSFIPRKAIEKKSLESAEYLTRENSDFYCVIPGIYSTQIDKYADATLLSIAWFIDEKTPVSSTMQANYYRDDSKSMTQNLYDVVTKDISANREYLRYWHGSLLFIRPMLTVLNIKQIYIFHGVLMAGLFLALVVYLFFSQMKAEAGALIVAMLMTNAVFTPLSLEYTWMFLVMLISSLVVVMMALKKPEREWGIVFLIIGMVSVFLDFFTTETLTLLIPLLLVMRVKQRNGLASGWTFIIKNSLLWGIGYVGMWVWKWGVASLVFRQNVMPYVRNNVQMHLGGFDNISGIELILDGLKRNVCDLFPFSFGKTGLIVTIIVLLVIVALIIMRKIRLRRAVDIERVLMYLVIGLIPYLRYIVIRHHSWYHHFFTYRAQASTILALCIIAVELFEWSRTKKNKIQIEEGHGNEKRTETNNPHALSE